MTDKHECEMCTESFDEDDLTMTFYWTVCDECKEHHEEYDA